MTSPPKAKIPDQFILMLTLLIASSALRLYQDIQFPGGNHFNFIPPVIVPPASLFLTFLGVQEAWNF